MNGDAALQVVVREAARSLTARADATPLLLGARGSAVDLTLGALYFREPSLDPTTFAESELVGDSGLAGAIPLHLRYEVRGHRIVGTTLGYLDFRGLEVASGRRFAMLGECILGHKAARALRAGVGDHVLSTPTSAFDVAGSFPLKMPVVGVLAAKGTPDDEAVFVDLKTTWVISGLAHGHQDVTVPEAASGVLSRTEDNVVANASVLSYTEITPDNIDSFHFHGDIADFPLTAIIAVPNSEKSGTLLRGRFLDPEEKHQVQKPSDVVLELLATVFTIQGFVVAALLLVAATTLATMALVFSLSLRLRRREIETMIKIGGARTSIAAVVVSEILGVLLAGTVAAALLTWLIAAVGSDAVRAIVR